MTELDKDWMALILEAKRIGLSKEEVRKFLLHCERENRKELSYLISHPYKGIIQDKFMRGT